MLHDDEKRLVIAGVSLALRGEGAHRAGLRQADYQPFLTARPPDATVDVITAEVNRDRTFDAPEIEVDGWSLSYHLTGAEGTLDAAADAGWLKLTADERLAHGGLAMWGTKNSCSATTDGPIRL